MIELNQGLNFVTHILELFCSFFIEKAISVDEIGVFGVSGTYLTRFALFLGKLSGFWPR